MKRVPVSWGLCVAAAATVSACSSMANHPGDSALASGDPPFGAVLAQRFEELNVPGAGYAVVVDGTLVEAGGLGVRNAETGDAVDETTPFRIASLTKPIAAALLLTAAAERKLSLDTPLAEASTRYGEHCPRIKDYFDRRGSRLMTGIDCDDTRVTLRSVATHTSRTPVGSTYAYNGYLFGLMGEAIAAAYQPWSSFEDIMRSHVIDPLGLKHTAAGPNDPAAPETIVRLAPPHVPSGAGGWEVKPPLAGRLSPAAGLISSAYDLAQVDMAMTPGGFVSADVWHRMTTPTVLADGSASPYAIGWFVQIVDGRKIVWHYGWQPNAYSSLWVRDTANGTSLILLANSDGLSRPYRLGRGDLTRSPIVRWFLDWSAARAAAAR